MNERPERETHYKCLKAPRYMFSRFFASMLLCLASGSMLIGFVYARPYFSMLKAWNAVMRNDSTTVEKVATRLLRHKREVYRHWGIYYRVLSKIMHQNLKRQEMLALRKSLIAEYFYFNRLMPDKDISQFVPIYDAKKLSTIEKSMHMLLGYVDFYRMDYDTAMKVYWGVLKQYEDDDTVRHNYEMALFFRNYTRVNEKEREVRATDEAGRQEAGKPMPNPSLIKLYRGSSYYMLERDKGQSTLPPY